MKQHLQVISLVIILASALSSCTSTASPTPTATAVPPTETAQPFTLTSTAFEANALIPERYACHGEKLSPALAWSNPPANTQSFALIMEDPDAVKVVGYIWDHWLLFNIPASTLSLAEGIASKAELPDGSRHGQNSSKALGYGAPCPPNGQTHTYRFTVYAADTLLELEPGATKAEIMQALEGHILAQAELDGRYTSP